MDPGDRPFYFSVPPVSDQQADDEVAVEKAAQELVDVVMARCPDCAERATAIHKVREAVMWAWDGIGRHGRPEPEWVLQVWHQGRGVRLGEACAWSGPVVGDRVWVGRISYQVTRVGRTDPVEKTARVHVEDGAGEARDGGSDGEDPGGSGGGDRGGGPGVRAPEHPGRDEGDQVDER